MIELAILTDAAGFTTCCKARRVEMLREASRVPLLSPIQVSEWNLAGDGITFVEWRLRQTYEWDGLI